MFIIIHADFQWLNKLTLAFFSPFQEILKSIGTQNLNVTNLLGLFSSEDFMYSIDLMKCMMDAER